MLHELTLLDKVVEVACQLHNLCYVMVRILLVRRALDAIDKRDEVLVSDRELLKQPVLLEESEGKVDEDVITEKLNVFKHIEVPFLDFIHDLKNIGPLSCIDFNDLS